ncbi:MAG TPA: hypothetical protein VEH07_10540, partial [Alphaproteobacteria bacterium]|nr:hypothetical protein [Alphaproteobacteria bacterium]
SPINYDNLLIFQGYNQILPVNLKKSLLSASQLGTWQAQGAWIYATEYFDATYRDFAIPLSSLVYGQNVTRNGSTYRIQRYMYGRMIGWANGTYGFAGNGLTDFASYSTKSADLGSWSFAMTATAKDASDPSAFSSNNSLAFEPSYAFHNAATSTDLSFGYGSGAAFLSGTQGFGLRADYDVRSGGVNPILGFASGGLYAGGSAPLSKTVSMSFGFTQNVSDNTFVNPMTHEVQAVVKGIPAYDASAAFLKLGYEPTSWMKLHASYTLLDEATGLLGVQGIGAFGLSGGAQTDAVTADASFDLGGNMTLAASATAGKTRSTSFTNSAIAVGDGGITSTAFEIAVSKLGIVEKDDALRLSLTQPLHVESGTLKYASWQVVDRQTGSFGLVTDKWKISNGDRELLAGLLYARPILGGAAHLSFSGQMDLNQAGSGQPGQDLSVGSRLTFEF